MEIDSSADFAGVVTSQGIRLPGTHESRAGQRRVRQPADERRGRCGIIGVNATTGRSLPGLDNLYQSIDKILTTPLATCAPRHAFGPELADLVDQPDNGAIRTRLYAAVAMHADPGEHVGRRDVGRVGIGLESGNDR